MVKRILKTLGALAAGHGIQTLTQLLVPPAFIAAYGVKGYGEWLVLSAAVGYLTTLDFGLQTFVLNELTALYHRNEMEQFHKVQSVGLRLMLMLVGAGVFVVGCAFLLPLARILRISGSQTGVAWTVFWLALQVLASIPLGQVIGVYRTFGQAHQGVMWGNLTRLLLVAVTVGLAWVHVRFWLIAAAQTLIVLMILAAVILTLRWSKPEVCPRLDYWDRQLAKQILKPSSFFGLFILNNFLVYQVPILMLQRYVGTELVVAFSIARTLFSFVRQGAALVQQGVAPEITRLNGVGDKEKLVRLYISFEGVVLAAVLIVNAGLLLAAPLVLKVWLRRPGLFDLNLFVLVMLVSILSSVKEYKMYFQYMTNRHIKSGLASFSTYLAMILISFPAIQWFGITGFMSLWLAVEFLQLGLVHSYNAQLLAGYPEINLWRALRLGLALVAIILLSFSARSLLQSNRFALQGIAACSVMVVLAGVSYFLFNLGPVLREGKGQLLKVLA